MSACFSCLSLLLLVLQLWLLLLVFRLSFLLFSVCIAVGEFRNCIRWAREKHGSIIIRTCETLRSHIVMVSEKGWSKMILGASAVQTLHVYKCRSAELRTA